MRSMKIWNGYVYPNCEHPWWCPDQQRTLSDKLHQPCYYSSGAIVEAWAQQIMPWAPQGNLWADGATPLYSPDHLPAALVHPTRTQTSCYKHELQREAHDIHRPFSVRDCFLHLLANSCHKSIVLWWLNLFLCPPYRKKWRKKAEMLGLLQIFPIITHCVQRHSCDSPNAGEPVHVPFQTQHGVWRPFTQVLLDFIPRWTHQGACHVTQPFHGLSQDGLALPQSFVMNHSLQIHLASAM